MGETMAGRKPLRVLYTFDETPYPLHYGGGSQRSCHEIMCALTAQGLKTMVVASRRGVERGELTRVDEGRLGVRVVESGTDGVVYDCGYPVVVLEGDFEAGLRRRMAQFAPDVVCTQHRGAIAVLRMARQAGAAASKSSTLEHQAGAESRACSSSK